MSTPLDGYSRSHWMFLALKPRRSWPPHGLRGGTYVRLRNPDGIVSNPIRVHVTERIGPDSVFMAHGFGHESRRLRLTFGAGADDSALMTHVKMDALTGGTGMRANYVTFVQEPA